MTRTFEEIVFDWEEHELFYKDLYCRKQENEARYREYLSTLNSVELQNEGLVIPDLFEPYKELDEIDSVFDLDTDIAVWKHSRYTPASPHSHTYFEIVCVLNGTAHHIINDKTAMELGKGDICILPDKVKHSIEVMEDDGIVINIMLKKSTFQYTFFDILSSDNILSRFFQDALFGKNGDAYLLFKTGDSDDQMVRSTIEKLFMEYYYHRKYYETMLKCMVTGLFTLLLRNFEKYYIPERKSRKELEIYRYLKENYTNTSLEAAAKHFNYSTAYFSRMIKKITGENFSDLLMKYRLNMACRLLRESNLQIGQICGIVGYNKLEHFNRQFKKLFQTTPSQYRKDTKNAE